jgi:trehalose/maltose transport system permease protein
VPHRHPGGRRANRQETGMFLWKRAETLAAAQARTALLFLAPTFLVLAAVGLYPLGRTVWLSFTDASFFDDRVNFVWFDNYLDLSADPEWWAALSNTVFFAVVSVALQLVLGIAFAMVLNANFPGRKFARAANLIPLVIALTVASQLWKWMYHDIFGVVNDAAMRLGLIARPIAWLNDPDTALWAIILMATWKFVPFVTLLVLAGLQSIPKELYEAAEIDGAGPVARFFRVTLPMLRGTLAVIVVFRMLDALRVFDIVYVMTGNSPATVTISMFARQRMIEFGLIGSGSAASVEIFLLILVGTIVYMRMLKVEER